jgi:hypothetical protein
LKYINAICESATWSREEKTMADGRNSGDSLNQLSSPVGVLVDSNNDSALIIADYGN